MVVIDIQLDVLVRTPLNPGLQEVAPLHVVEYGQVSAPDQARKRLLQGNREGVEAVFAPRFTVRVVQAADMAAQQVALALVHPLQHEVGGRKGGREAVILLQRDVADELVLLDRLAVQADIAEPVIERVGELRAQYQLVQQAVRLALEHVVETEAQDILLVVLAYEVTLERTETAAKPGAGDGVVEHVQLGKGALAQVAGVESGPAVGLVDLEGAQRLGRREIADRGVQARDAIEPC